MQRLKDEIAEAVSDAILSGATNDPVLAQLLDITILSIGDGRHIFPNPMDEPILYRHFKKCVKEAMGGLDKIEKEMEKAFEQTGRV